MAQSSSANRVEKFGKDKKNNREEMRTKNDDRKKNKQKRGKDHWNDENTVE